MSKNIGSLKMTKNTQTFKLNEFIAVYNNLIINYKIYI
jgi:hypothetical protein